MKHISLYAMTVAMLVLSAGCTLHMAMKAMTDESLKLLNYGLLSEAAQKKESQYPQLSSVGCCRFQRHRVRCMDETGGESWSDESLRGSSSVRRSN